MRPTILILLDGLRYDTARACLGYMEGLVRAGDAQVYEVTSELPSLSRPLYETLVTGLPPVEHGVVANGVVRLSECPNVFGLARRAGLVTAAAAYHWFSELHNRAPFTPADRWVENGDGNIQHGLFYWRDDYPDDHLFADADALIRRHAPHVLLLHPMNVDDQGHKHGGDSVPYRNAARRQGDLLALALPRWRAQGYTVLVTSDHGMGPDGNHGGPHETEARVPLYTVGRDAFTLDPALQPRQTEIAGLICSLLGLADHGLPVTPGLLRPPPPPPLPHLRHEGLDIQDGQGPEPVSERLP